MAFSRARTCSMTVAPLAAAALEFVRFVLPAVRLVLTLAAMITILWLNSLG